MMKAEPKLKIAIRFHDLEWLRDAIEDFEAKYPRLAEAIRGSEAQEARAAAGADVGDTLDVQGFDESDHNGTFRVVGVDARGDLDVRRVNP